MEEYQETGMTSKTMVKIENVTVVPLIGGSAFLQPMRMTFTQNTIPRFWDFSKVHNG